MRIFSGVHPGVCWRCPFIEGRRPNFAEASVNTAFQAGEILTYKVLYKLGGVYVGAGEAVFNTTLEHLNGKEV